MPRCSRKYSAAMLPDMPASRASSSREAVLRYCSPSARSLPKSDLLAELSRATSGILAALVSRTCSTMNCSAICDSRPYDARRDQVEHHVERRDTACARHAIAIDMNSLFRKRVSGNSSLERRHVLLKESHTHNRPAPARASAYAGAQAAEHAAHAGEAAQCDQMLGEWSCCTSIPPTTNTRYPPLTDDA